MKCCPLTVYHHPADGLKSQENYFFSFFTCKMWRSSCSWCHNSTLFGAGTFPGSPWSWHMSTLQWFRPLIHVNVVNISKVESASIKYICSVTYNFFEISEKCPLCLFCDSGLDDAGQMAHQANRPGVTRAWTRTCSASRVRNGWESSWCYGRWSPSISAARVNAVSDVGTPRFQSESGTPLSPEWRWRRRGCRVSDMLILCVLTKINALFRQEQTTHWAGTTNIWMCSSADFSSV